MRPRSIRFRLVVFYACTFLLVCSAFGAYTYAGLGDYLRRGLQDSLRWRAQQIGSSLVRNLERTGEGFVIEQIRALYAPEVNNRFVRLVRPDGSVLYVSGPPGDGSFEPQRIARMTARPGETLVRDLADQHLLLVSLPYAASGGSYLVEVGASTLELEGVLRGFLGTLLLGLPAILALAVLGASLLVKQALAPVQHVIEAAHAITSSNLGRRLPVARTGDEIERLSVALNEMIARLDDAFQHAARFTADASHELRTPLTVLRGELEALIHEPGGTPELKGRLATVLEETERLARIVEGLLAIGRLEAGEAVAERVRFDLAGLVATTADQMSLLAEEKEIEVRCVNDAPVEVVGDRARLKQVVVNLLDNAIKYSPRHGRIVLATSRAQGFAVLEVGDSGPGIPEAALTRVFDRFFRVAAKPTAGAGGSGLGLAIVRLICTAHGGTVSARNESAGGCRISVSLPLAD